MDRSSTRNLLPLFVVAGWLAVGCASPGSARAEEERSKETTGSENLVREVQLVNHLANRDEARPLREVSCTRILNALKPEKRFAVVEECRSKLRRDASRAEADVVALTTQEIECTDNRCSIFMYGTAYATDE